MRPRRSSTSALRGARREEHRRRSSPTGAADAGFVYASDVNAAGEDLVAIELPDELEPSRRPTASPSSPTRRILKARRSSSTACSTAQAREALLEAEFSAAGGASTLSLPLVSRQSSPAPWPSRSSSSPMPIAAIFLEAGPAELWDALGRREAPGRAAPQPGHLGDRARRDRRWSARRPPTFWQPGASEAARLRSRSSSCRSSCRRPWPASGSWSRWGPEASSAG